MARRSWQELDPRVRRAIVITSAVEGALKIAALIDLWRRPAAQVRGPKRRWALAIAFVNSAGAVPIAYFLRGRRPAAQATSTPNSRAMPASPDS